MSQSDRTQVLRVSWPLSKPDTDVAILSFHVKTDDMTVSNSELDFFCGGTTWSWFILKGCILAEVMFNNKRCPILTIFLDIQYLHIVQLLISDTNINVRSRGINSLWLIRIVLSR